MAKYLNDTPIKPKHYEKLIAAMKNDLPALVPLLISDRTDEVASIGEANTARINVVTKMALEDYINPYYLANESCRAWQGFLDIETDEVYSISLLNKGAWRNMPATRIKRFTVSFMDIRNFIYNIEIGDSLCIYDLFAGQLLNMTDKDLLEIKKFASKVFSVQSIYSRYVGALDSITARVQHYVAYLKQRRALVDTDKQAIKDVRTASNDVPSNNKEVKELFTLFLFTWVRANMVTRFILDRRAAKTEEEKAEVKNELICGWWNKNTDSFRYADEDMFTFAMRNMLIKNIAVSTGVSGIRYDDGCFGDVVLPETAVEHDNVINSLTDLIEGMVMITNDIRSRVGNVPPNRTVVREETIALVKNIIMGV